MNRHHDFSFSSKPVGMWKHPLLDDDQARPMTATEAQGGWPPNCDGHNVRILPANRVAPPPTFMHPRVMPDHEIRRKLVFWACCLACFVGGLVLGSFWV